RGSSGPAPEKQCGVLFGLDPQPHTSPLNQATLSRRQVLDLTHPPARLWSAEFDLTKMEPELTRLGGEGDRDRHGIVARHGLLDEADDLAVIDLREAQIVGLLQGRVGAAQAVEMRDIVLD